LDFGTKGKILWKTDARGTRALRNNVIYGEWYPWSNSGFGGSQS
jgi:hypothetical protein